MDLLKGKKMKVKSEAKIYKIRFGRLLICCFFFALSSVCWPIHLVNTSCGFQKSQITFNQKFT